MLIWHRANEVRPVLKHLGSVAKRYNCAIILIGHMNKSATKSQYRGIASIDFSACARSVLTMGCVNQNADIRVIVQTKNSLESYGTPIAFEMSEKCCFEYVGGYEISIDDLLSGGSGVSKIDEAKAIINQCLSANNNESAYILSKGKDKGISERTMKTAKTKLNLNSIKKGAKWYWTYQSKSSVQSCNVLE